MERDKLKEFYKAYLKKANDEKMESMVMTGVLLFCSIFVLFIPWQSISEEGGVIGVGVWMWMVIIAVAYYIQQYRICKEGKKQIKMSEKLRFFPVSKQDMKLFYMKKIIRFSMVVCSICIVAQVLLALMFYHSLTWGNLLYPLFLTFLLPVALNGVVICLG